ncbi:AzlD domain-containing protein [Microbacteriaceae bacterium 4G12]
MSSLAILLLFFSMGAVTYFVRRALLRLPNQRLSNRLRSGLSFIPIGIFASLIFPSLFVKDGNFVIEPVYIIASILCVGFMIWKRNVFISFATSLFFVILVKVFTEY